MSFPKFCEKYLLSLENNAITNNILLYFVLVLIVQICKSENLLLLSSSPAVDGITGAIASLMILGVGAWSKHFRA